VAFVPAFALHLLFMVLMLLVVCAALASVNRKSPDQYDGNEQRAKSRFLLTHGLVSVL
jgi:hypothetical protein